MRSLKFPLLLFVLALLLTACTKGSPLLFQFRGVDETCWEPSSPVELTLDSLTEAGPRTCTVYVRTGEAHPYPYTDLYLEVSQRWLIPDSCQAPDTTYAGGLYRVDTDRYSKHRTLVFCDTVAVPISRSDGINLHAQEAELPATPDLPVGSQATFRIRHVMSHYRLPGICEVGLRVD